MQKIKIGQISTHLNDLGELECQLDKAGQEFEYSKAVERVRGIIDPLHELCKSGGFLEPLERLSLAVMNIEERHQGAGELRVHVQNAKETVLSALFRHEYLLITQDRKNLIDQKELFGRKVADSFPSATKDLTEAGNCLAVECGTAAVFHLMRAAELCLRNLAKDRKVSFRDKPLEEKEWGQILVALEARLSEMRNENRNRWTSPEIRDAQIRFYNEVIQELRGFNDAWRRHVSHADACAFYDRDSAMGIFKHVRTFMQKLAEKISEASLTETYWPSI